MPNFGMLPLGGTLLGLATVTTNGTSANLVLPPASSYRLIVQVQTITGTLPTMQVILATSCDAGTTYNEILSTNTQITASGLGQQLLIRPYLGIGDSATVATCSLLGTADLNTNVVNNGPIVPGFIKVRWIIGGTTPSIAWQLQFVAIPQDLSD
jgi:hypothetical protein